MSDYPVDSSRRQAGLFTAVPSLQITRGGNEIDLLYKAPFLVVHGNQDLRSQAGYIVGPTRSGKAHLGVVGITDKRAVQIPVLVNLGTPPESRSPRNLSVEEGEHR